MKNLGRRLHLRSDTEVRLITCHVAVVIISSLDCVDPLTLRSLPNRMLAVVYQTMLGRHTGDDWAGANDSFGTTKMKSFIRRPA